ncbi:cytochrome P450 [Nemania sp. FL0031]|nr:cytochrome P450 [Nemania sp. FL0031]
MNSISIFGTAIVATFSVVIAHYIWEYHERSRRRHHNSEIQHYRHIADFSFLNPTTLEDRLKLRAKPNNRLITAFNISNSFTTDDRHVHHEFLTRVKKVVHLVHTEDWIKLSEVSKTIMNLCLSHFKDGLPYIPIAPFVRVVSFSLVLHILFGIEPLEVDPEEVRRATGAINRLWIQSKNEHAAPSLYDKKMLNNALERLFPEETMSDDRIRPLDLIMPAYETLWRIVLLTFVSAASRNSDTTEEELQEAMRNVPQCFFQKNDIEMRALAIAKEGLRLYPPTKRIYRAKSTTDGESGVIFANVLACHRNGLIWGADALEFKPRRFHNWSHAEERLSYFPFGIGRHLCPASAGYGDRIITLLVVELARRFGTRQTGLKIHFGDVELQQRVSKPLPSGRGDMENWVLEIDEEA